MSEIISLKIDFLANITIYGSYYPENAKKRLISLRDCLISNGFSNTHLVEDHPDNYFPFDMVDDEDINNLIRSRYCITHSFLNILLYTFNGNQSGVTVELEEIIRQNLDSFLIIIEKNEEGILAPSTLVIGRLKEIGRAYISVPVKDDDYICTTIYNRIHDFFLSNKSNISNNDNENFDKFLNHLKERENDFKRILRRKNPSERLRSLDL